MIGLKEVAGTVAPGTVVEKLLILSDGRTFPATDGPVTVEGFFCKAFFL